jgi:MarR family transcriptional regulator for hemolysin
MTSLSDTFLTQDRLASAMHRCGHAWREAVNEALAPLNITHLQWVVVQHIVEHPGWRQTELADHMGIEGPSLVRVLDGLEHGGWVERRPCPDDRRAKRVYLKEESEPRIKQAFDALRHTHERAVENLSEEQRGQLVQLLDAMSDGLLAGS